MRWVLPIVFLITGHLIAGPPQKYPLTKYRSMWEQSLVTEKPPPPEKEEVEDTTALDDYALSGWTQTEGGYFVTLINQKNPTERLTVSPGLPSPPGLPPIKVVRVDQNPNDFMSAKVVFDVGGKQKTIGFEEKLLTLRNNAPKAPAANNRNNRNNQQQRNQAQQNRNANANNNANAKPPIPTNANNSSNNNSSSARRRTPRVRRVPTPPK